MLFISTSDYKVDDSEDWIELLESLQDAYQDNSVALKKETASAFVPTAMRLKKCLRLCDEQDRKYGEGILMLNSTLKKHELLVIKMEDEMKEAYSLAQNRIDMTVKQLEEAYSHRDKLWSRFHEKIAQIAEPVAQVLREVPVNIERIIAAQEKRCRAQEKEEGNSTLLTEDILKDLLKKL